jgi:hypothetical protein
MHKQHPEVLFIGTLLAAIIASLFFLGGSITGYVTQTMYCDENGDCNDFCDSDYDCDEYGKICCEISGQGICYAEEACVDRYNLFHERQSKIPDYYKNPIQTAQERAHVGIAFFSIMTFMIIVVAIVFFFNSHHLHPKKKNSKKKSKKLKK